MTTIEKAPAITESITFRIPLRVLDRIRHESEHKQVSTNTLVNQIFKEHVDWHFAAAQAGFVPVRRGMVARLVEHLTDKEIVEIAQQMAGETKGFVLLLRDEYSLTSALDVFESWIRASGYAYVHKSDAGRHSYVIQHKMSRKWSLYLAEQFRFLFKEYGLKEPEFDVTDDTVSFKADAS